MTGNLYISAGAKGQKYVESTLLDSAMKWRLEQFEAKFLYGRKTSMQSPFSPNHLKYIHLFTYLVKVTRILIR